MSRLKIVGYGSKAELWLDNRMIGRDVSEYTLTHEAGMHPKLTVTYNIEELEVEADNVEVVKRNEIRSIHSNEECIRKDDSIDQITADEL